MIAMHYTLTGRLPAPLGMMALLGLAVAVGVTASLYLTEWFIYPMQWVTDFLRNAEWVLNSVLHAAGLADTVSANYYDFARRDNVGVFSAGLYIATEVLYLVAVLVVATKAATQASLKATPPKKTVTLYLLVNLAYTFAFFYWVMFSLGYAQHYEQALLGPFRDDATTLADMFIGSWSWKLMAFVPLQLALMIGIWKDSRWFKPWFTAYLLFDVAFYALLTWLTTSSHSGLFVSAIALLVFTPYLHRK